MSKGTLVRRHRIPFAGPVPTSPAEPDNSDLVEAVYSAPRRTFAETHITLWDLNVRRDIVVYGRSHRIVDCDAFTRAFLGRLGVSVPPPEPVKEDYFTNRRNEVTRKRTIEYAVC